MVMFHCYVKLPEGNFLKINSNNHPTLIWKRGSYLPTKISDQTSKNQVDYGWLPIKIMKSTPSSYLGRHKPCRSRPTAHLRTPSASCPKANPRKPGAFRGAEWSQLRSWPQPWNTGLVSRLQLGVGFCPFWDTARYEMFVSILGRSWFTIGSWGAYPSPRTHHDISIYIIYWNLSRFWWFVQGPNTFSRSHQSSIFHCHLWFPPEKTKKNARKTVEKSIHLVKNMVKKTMGFRVFSADFPNQTQTQGIPRYPRCWKCWVIEDQRAGES